ncbi:MAG: futalosine hydrolase [Thermodesulfovibrionales bacterium]|nr:futalosine hydrolase [Thermodesulfovibrionales bacterium]
MSLLGIIASTEIEAGLIIGRLSQKELSTIQGKNFYRGFLGDRETTICICGIGKANAAHGTALLIERFKPGLLYIIGVAGAYPSSGLNIGDIAVAEKEIYGDEGLAIKTEVRSQESEVREKDEINFCTMDKLNLPLAAISGNNYYNEFPLFIPEKLKDAAKGNFITVSTCTGTLEKGSEIEKRFNALCENMEGAAIAHVCSLSGIPTVEIRGISNIIEDRTAAPLNKSDIVKAAKNAQRFFLDNYLSGI